MAEEHSRAEAASALPDAPNLHWLRKQAKRRLQELRKVNPEAQLADAQFDLAKRYGFPSWRALKAHIDALSVTGQLFEAARTGDVATLGALLDAHPDALLARSKPYEATLLHAAAQHGHLAVVDLLLTRGIDPNTREKGDNTSPMHWAAAGGHLDVVRRLADAGGDVVGRGDDHALEVIGWATCWKNYQAHVAEFLLERGAKHHIFSAVALDLADEVRRIVREDPGSLSSRLTRNDSHRTPLHHAVLNDRPRMVALLLELGADPLAVDGSGHAVADYATTPNADAPVMERIRAMTAAELDSAARGQRAPNVGMSDFVAALALGEWSAAEQLMRERPALLAPTGADTGALVLLSKRNDVRAVRWLLDHGADPNARWNHWGAEVTGLHLAAMQGHVEVARLLLDRGADPRIRDSMHDGDARGWAEYSNQPAIAKLLEPFAR